MLAITEITPIQKATNCIGPMEWFNDQDFEIEDSDVGQKYENYLGHQHKTYRMRSTDVGRRIRITTQGAHYRCWSFLS